MNETDALNLLIQASSVARLTKMEHIQIEQAAGVLAAFLKEHIKAEPAERPPGPRAVESLPPTGE